MVLYPRNGGRSGPKTRKMRRLRSDFRRDSRARHYRCCRPVCFVPPRRQATAMRQVQAITAFLKMAIGTPQILQKTPFSPPAQGRAFPHASFSHRSDPPRTPTSMRQPFTRANLTGGEARPACASRKNIFLLCDTHRPQKHWRIKIFSPPCRAQYFLTPRCEPAIPVPCKAQRSNERRQ